MNRISKLIQSYTGKTIISILLGLGLATLFRKACKDRQCMVFYAAPTERVHDKIYKFNDKCYTFNNLAKSCDLNKKTVQTEPIEHV